MMYKLNEDIRKDEFKLVKQLLPNKEPVKFIQISTYKTHGAFRNAISAEIIELLINNDLNLYTKNQYGIPISYNS